MWLERHVAHEWPLYGELDEVVADIGIIVAGDTGNVTNLQARNGAHCNMRHFVDVIGTVNDAVALWEKATVLITQNVEISDEFHVFLVSGAFGADGFDIFFYIAKAGFVRGRDAEFTKKYVETWIKLCLTRPHFKCVICKGYYYNQGAGNNPAPLANEGVCCNL